MTKREHALATIRAEVAETGEVTFFAMRAYVENRISRKAFNEAVAQGMKAFNAAAVRRSAAAASKDQRSRS